jgi:hypothetical protein
MQDLLVRNTLDVMHCEKNLCENILKTIFCIKDTMVVQEELKECGIRTHLWLQIVASGLIKLVAYYVLKIERRYFFMSYI